MGFEMRARIRTSIGLELNAAGLSIHEGYNVGWGGNLLVSAMREERPITSTEMMSIVMAHGAWPGSAATVEIYFRGGDLDGQVARRWPCMISSLTPQSTNDQIALCVIHVVDPVSMLAEATVWGAYRGTSLAEAIGGGLSLARGGPGEPTTTPALEGMPEFIVRGDHRSALEAIPYVIATGQTLGEWIARLVGMVGVRVRLDGSVEDTAITMTLEDGPPKEAPKTMTIIDPLATEAITGDTSMYGPISIRGQGAFTGRPLRGGLLDDPTKGGAMPVLAPGPVETVIGQSDIDIDEASARLYRNATGRYAEMLLLAIASRQHELRPGTVIEMDENVHGIRLWQVGAIQHVVRGTIYDNDATLMRGEVGWHPPIPDVPHPTMVNARVDGGSDYTWHEPVERDRLGRVKVRMAFLPSAMGAKAADLALADSDSDGTIETSDFSATKRASYEDESEQWEAALTDLESGALNDPFLGIASSELTEAQLKQREELSTARRKALEYRIYKQARARDQADADRDGVVSARDAMISNELSQALNDPEKRLALEEEWRAQEERKAKEALDLDEEPQTTSEDGTDGGSDGTDEETTDQGGTGDGTDDGNTTIDEEDVPELPEESLTDSGSEDADENAVDPALLAEYGRLFGDVANLDPETDAELIDARKDAERMQDRWPPRIALQIVEPMAGALHGFISAHRQGDICRVAVHDPMHAEIVGFQYRGDRRINEELAGTLGGMVIEHNYGEQWSGIVFRRTEDLDTERYAAPEKEVAENDETATTPSDASA